MCLVRFWRHYGSLSRHLMALKLQRYTKFLFVRDPFVRLISAFRNKFGRYVSISELVDREWLCVYVCVCTCACTLRLSIVPHFSLNSSPLVLKLIKCVCFCLKGPMRTSTGSLVPSWCVGMVMCLAACQRRQRRHLQQESNQRFSTLSHTYWIQRLRGRISLMNTGGRCLSHTAMHTQATVDFT